MRERDIHGEWLSLMDISGPFLAQPVLKDIFPQGLEGVEPERRKRVRQAYDEWREAVDLDDPALAELHRAWVELVLRDTLEYGDLLFCTSRLPLSLKCDLAEHGITIRPDYALIDNAETRTPLVFVSVYPVGMPLNDAIRSGSYVASPAERTIELCRATGIRMAILTNGEQWMYVDAPVNAVTTRASWYGRLWSSEPLTLQAFISLLGVRRFFGAPTERLPALLERSLSFQDEVTDALGEQVQRAVEVLVQALDREDLDRNRELLKGVEPEELYEAGLTVMMRIVFLLSAEERGLLLLGERTYEENYAVSTLRMQLRQESEDIQERRWDAWSRLLALFRIVFGGIEHETLRLPALGGSLFDPDRFPFLEGRRKGSDWKTDPAQPLPIDNRTVLLLLEAVQLFQGRTLSYLALDVEQIGYVYEGLLERTVVRAREVTLDLRATKSAKQPRVLLSELDEAAADGKTAIEDLLKERTGSAIGRIHNDLAKAADDEISAKLLAICNGDFELRDRIEPYAHLLRTDGWGYPLVYPTGAFMVAAGTDRRETGTHYTPKSFTESIVKETLEPLVYEGPAEGVPIDSWKLKSPSELLRIKICDPAMGSGAFLVQVCRWLAERLVEAWNEAEKSGKAVTVDGEVIESGSAFEPLPSAAEERVLIAKRLIAERCLYGVDANPLAVELAKLSIWLVTLAKGRPFGFLDHNLRCGDSLLGITDLDQLRFLEMKPGPESTKKLFAASIDEAIAKAIEIRTELRQRPIRDIRDVEAMARLDGQAREELRLLDLAADALIGEALAHEGKSFDTASLSIEVGDALAGKQFTEEKLSTPANSNLATDLPEGKQRRRPLHWPLEFPEVFTSERKGFDAFVGNPPFLGGKLISGSLGESYQSYIVKYATLDIPSSVDLAVHFFIRVFILLKTGGCAGLLGRRSMNEAKNRAVGFRQLLERGVTIYNARTDITWPGKAAVVVHQIALIKGTWAASRLLNGSTVDIISSSLTDVEQWTPQKLNDNSGMIFQGSILSGEGFKVSDETARTWIANDPTYEKVVYPFIVGDTINNDAYRKPVCWAICFWDWTEESAKEFPEAYHVAEQRVKPERQSTDESGKFLYPAPLPKQWWRYEKPRPALYHKLGRGEVFASHPRDWRKDTDKVERVLVISTSTTKYPAYTYLDSNFIYSNTLCILADSRYELFAILSSDIHGVWAWMQKTTRQTNMEGMRYAHGNIFETFPFPNGFLSIGNPTLEDLGNQFFSLRQTYMENHDIGLTGFYNAFHDPSKRDDALLGLRKRQSEINRTVASTYAWNDIDLTCDFYSVEYLPAGRNTRFSVSEPARIEVLQRLLVLNKTMHAAEAKPKSDSGRPILQTAQIELWSDEAEQADELLSDD